MKDLVIDHSGVDFAMMKKYPHLFFENRGKLYMTLEDYKEFLLTATYFDDSWIIEEGKQVLDSIPDEAVREIISSNWSRIPGNFFKEKLKTSKHWRNLKNVEIQDVFPCLFDFKNPKDIDKFNYNALGIKMSSDLQKARDMFLEKVSHLAGFCNFGEDIYFICINTKSTDIEQTIRYELTHFLQVECKIKITQGIDDTRQDKILKRQEDFPSFSLKEVVDYFSGIEFIPHIQDILDDISRCREKFYHEMSSVDFWKLVLEMAHCNTEKELLENDLFMKIIEANNRDVSAPMMLVFSRLSGYRWQKILDILRTSIFSHK